MKDPFQKRECAICVFFLLLNEKKKRGECRRLAPQCVVKYGATGSGYNTLWPCVSADDFCGEFQGKLEL